MNRLILATLITVLLVFSFSGCQQKRPTIKFIKSKCPQSRKWDVNKTIPSYKLEYKKTKDKKDIVMTSEKFFLHVKFIKELKERVLKLTNIITLYEEQSDAHNDLIKDTKRGINDKYIH